MVPLSIFETIAQKRMQGLPVIGVGTTMIRLLESLPLLWTQLTQKDIWSREVIEWWDLCYDAAKEYEHRRIEYLANQDGRNDDTKNDCYQFVHIREA